MGKMLPERGGIFPFSQVKPVETIKKNLKTASMFLISYSSLDQQKFLSCSDSL